MNTLTNQTQSHVITTNLKIARSMFARMKGLLGKKDLLENEMLWIHHCNSIHTFFMQFPIDCIFLDKTMSVCGIKTNIKPWRIVLPVLKANSVIEMKAGKSQTLNLRMGDQLHVGH